MVAAMILLHGLLLCAQSSEVAETSPKSSREVEGYTPINTIGSESGTLGS